MSEKKATARRVTRETPRTAYELLARVSEHILEEPKRYWQDIWGVRGVTAKRAFLSLPSCETVACRAGWIVALHDGMGALCPVNGCCYFGVSDRASEILGLTWEDTRDLFKGDPRTSKRRHGSEAYAEKGARGIHAFMKQHQRHLKGRLLADVPKA